jgi:hypothetical protein
MTVILGITRGSPRNEISSPAFEAPFGLSMKPRRLRRPASGDLTLTLIRDSSPSTTCRSFHGAETQGTKEPSLPAATAAPSLPEWLPAGSVIR